MDVILEADRFVNSNPVDELLTDSNYCDFEHKKDATRCPIIKIKIANVELPALIDSGSEICCIAQDTFDLVSPCLQNVPILPVQGIKVVGAFKCKQRRVTHQVLLPLILNGLQTQFEFLVIPDLVYPVIVGIDFLRAYKASINLSSSKITIQFGSESYDLPEIYPSHNFTSPGPCALQLCSINTSYPKYSECKPDNADIRHVLDSINLTDEEREQVHQLLVRHAKVFSDRPGLTTEYEHEIKLTDANPFFVKPYPIPVAHRDVVERELARMEEWGIIEPANTPYCSPLMTVVKRDGTVRLCLDARRLNQITEDDNETPMPIEDIMQELSNVKYMSSLDLTSSYWQIPIKEEHRRYTGFRVGSRVYQFKVLPFGLKPAVASFTRCMRVVLGSFFSDFVKIYVDDMFVKSSSFGEHIRHLDLLLTRLGRAGFTLRLRKCAFFKTEMRVLGYVLDPQGLRPDVDRVDAIKSYPVPKNKKQLQAFLGLANFDRAFVEHFATMSEPLVHLLRGNSKWIWGREQVLAFESIQKHLSKEVLVYHPDFRETFFVQCDASDVGLGAVLFQMINKQRRVVGYASRILLQRERNYSVPEKELLSVVFALRKWRSFLLGRRFVVLSDHKSLSYLGSCRLLSGRITRWALALQEYSFEIRHISGAENFVPDVLSRCPPCRLPTPQDKCFRVLSLREKSVFREILRDMAEKQRNDIKLSPIIQALKDGSEVSGRYVLHDELLYLHRDWESSSLLCIPKVAVDGLISAYHEELGHYGVYKTWCAMRRDVWFPQMHSRIKACLKSCNICQMAKPSRMPKPELESILPEGPNELLAVDIYGPLPRSIGGTTYLFVALDVFSKYVALYALKQANTRTILKKLEDHYFPNIGKPTRILSDQGTQFTSRKWSQTLISANVQPVFCSVRHPQGNPSERVMRELGRLFRTYCHGNHKKWATEVSHFQELLNNVTHESTGFAPVEIHFGVTPTSPLRKYIKYPESAHADAHVKLYLAREHLETQARKRKARFTGFPIPDFKEGDLVLLRANPVSSALNHEIKKFLLLYEGPYAIKKRVSRNSFILVQPNTLLERGLFHASHLKPYYCVHTENVGGRNGGVDVPN